MCAATPQWERDARGKHHASHQSHSIERTGLGTSSRVHRLALLFGLLTAFLLNPGLVSAGTGGVSPQSANVSQFKLEDMITPSGALHLRIPLGEVPGRHTVSLPLVLQYDSTIPRSQTASWVGLGFSLNIGEVNRSVIYRPDEQSTLMFPPTGGFRLDKNPAEGEGNGSLVAAECDPADYYMLTLPEGTQRLQMIRSEPSDPASAEATLQQFRPWRVGFNAFPGMSIYNNTIAGLGLSNWVVLKEDGSRYIFSKASQFWVRNARAPTDPDRVTYAMPVAWQLTQILSATYYDPAYAYYPSTFPWPHDGCAGDYVAIAYKDHAGGPTYPPLDVTGQQTLSLGGTQFGYGMPGITGEERLYVDQSYVTRIDTPTHFARFMTSARTDCRSSDGRTPLRLDAIEIYARADSMIPEHTIQFVYAALPTDSDPAWAPGEMLRDSALTLVAVVVDQLPPIQFRYGANAPSGHYYPGPGYDGYSPAPGVGQYALTEMELPTGACLTVGYEPAVANWLFTGDNSCPSGVPFGTRYWGVPFETGHSRVSSLITRRGVGMRDTALVEYGQGVLIVRTGIARLSHEWNGIPQFFARELQYRSIGVRHAHNAGITRRYYTSGVTQSYVVCASADTAGYGPPPAIVAGEGGFPDVYNPVSNSYSDLSPQRGLVWRETLESEDGSIPQETSWGRTFVTIAAEPTAAYCANGTYDGRAVVVQRSTLAEVTSIQTRRDGVTETNSFAYSPSYHLLTEVVTSGGGAGTVMERREYEVDRRAALGGYNPLASWHQLTPIAQRILYAGTDGSQDSVREARRVSWHSTYLSRPGVVPESLWTWVRPDSSARFLGTRDTAYVLEAIQTHDEHGRQVRVVRGGIDTTEYVYRALYGAPSCVVTNANGPTWWDDFERGNAHDQASPVAWRLSAGDASIVEGTAWGHHLCLTNIGATYRAFTCQAEGGVQGSGVGWIGVRFGSLVDAIDVVGTLTVRFANNGTVSLHNGNDTLAVRRGCASSALPASWDFAPALHRIAVSVVGDTVYGSLDGKELLRAQVPSGTIGTGYVGLVGDSPEGVVCDNYCSSGAGAQVTASGRIACFYDGTFAMAAGGVRIGYTREPDGITSYVEEDLAGRPLTLWRGVAPGEASENYTRTRQWEYLQPADPSGDIGHINVIVERAFPAHGDTVTTATWSDGCDLAIERQVLDGTEWIVGRVSGGVGAQPETLFKQVARHGNSLALTSDYRSALATAFPSDSGVSYTVVEATRDPLQRTAKLGAPGPSNAIGRGHERSIAYRANSAMEVAGYGASELRVETVQDEDSRVTVTARDRRGRVVSTVRDSGGLGLTSTTAYSARGEVSRAIDPASRIHRYAYDTRGALVQSISPSEGGIRVWYDSRGLRRFVQDGTRGGAQNAVSSSGRLFGTRVRTVSFSLSRPGPVHVEVSRYLIMEPGDRGEGVLRDSRGTILAIVADDEAQSAPMSADVWLPKGSYTARFTSAGAGAVDYAVSCARGVECVYYKYDRMGRLREVGEFAPAGSATVLNRASADDPNAPHSHTVVWRTYVYDRPTVISAADGQENLSGRLSVERMYRHGVLECERSFSYDERGAVKSVVARWMDGSTIQDYEERDQLGRVTLTRSVERNAPWRSGGVVYRYDPAGRPSVVLAALRSDTSGTQADTLVALMRDAEGRVKRKVLGRAQGVDYTYNARGWITQVNGRQLDAASDPGGDGDSAMPADVYCERLGYDVLDGPAVAYGVAPSFGGGVSWRAYSIAGLPFEYAPLMDPADVMGFAYTRDGAGRLTSSRMAYQIYPLQPDTVAPVWVASEAYREGPVSYDDNGNVLALVRTGNTNTIDSLVYAYAPASDRVVEVRDAIGDGSVAGDIDARGPGAYAYDEAGQCIRDVAAGIGLVVYDPFGNPSEEYRCGDYRCVRLTYERDGGLRARRDGVDVRLVSGVSRRARAEFREDASYASWEFGDNGVDGVVECVGGEWRRRFFVKDACGNLRVVVDSLGAVVERHDAWAGGYPLPDRDSGLSSGVGAWRMRALPFEPVAGYVECGARRYDPLLGRFLTPDPEASGVRGESPYVFAHAGPLERADDDGRLAQEIWTALSISADVAYLSADIANRRWGWAAVDATGLALDLAAAATLTGGGAGMLMKGVRGERALEAVVQLGHSGEVLTGAKGASLEAGAAANAGRKAAAADRAHMVASAGGASRGGAGPVRVGQAGEARVRQAAEIGPLRKTPILVGWRIRIPDGLTGSVLTEVKDVASLSYTRQLRDFAEYAGANGLRFDLWVRRSTQLSGPLLDAKEAGIINVRYIP